MSRRLTVALVLTFALAASTSLLAADLHAAAKHDAQQAAASWLSLVDSGKYGDSWSSAASLFRKAVTQEKWRSAVQAIREPLGKVKARALQNATYFTSLPGAPDGEYVVIQYQTTFDHKQSAIETITPMRESDGLWRVSGYYVK